MTHRFLWGVPLWAMLFVAAACDDNKNRENHDQQEDTQTDPADAGPAPDAGVEVEGYGAISASLFSIDTLMEVSVEIDPAEWDALRFDAPGLEHFETACPAGPRPRSFEWHVGNVTVNGEPFGQVELRKKGLMGSMTSNRPSLKLRFPDDHRPSGVRRMTLNNAVSDPTRSRECLSYDLFRAAGIAAPRCGLARVTVNGETLGVYTHIEEIKNPMLKLNFGEDADKTELYELTIADFETDRLAMFEPKWLEEGEVADLSALEAVAQALELGDDQLLAALEPIIDLDQFFTYWAMEVITAHGDGYAGNQNNSYFYRNPQTGRFVFIPWGTDGTFYQPWDFFGDFTGEDRPLPWSVYANGALARRLLAHPEGRARYEERLRALLDTVWDEAALADKVNRIQATIGPHLAGNLEVANDMEVANLLQFIGAHKGRILAELDDGLPVWDRLPPPPLCAEIEHTLTGVLRTTMGTLESDLLETGEGEVTDLLGEDSVAIPLVRGVVGPYTDAFGYGMVHLEIGAGPVDGTSALVLIVDVPEELFQEGRSVKMDWGEAQTAVGLVDLMTGDFRLLGFVMTGELTVDALDPTPGGAVSISFHAPIGVIQV